MPRRSLIFERVFHADEPRSLPNATLLLAVLALAIAVGPAFAQDLIPPRTLDRKFPSSNFCPFPEPITFTAISTKATIEFSANTTYGATPIRQAIDALCVADAFQVATNSGPCAACNAYIDNEGPHPVDSFFFDYFGPQGQTIAWLEQFDSNPAGRGWDLTRGATWNATNSGPRDPGSGGGDRTGGSLELFANGPCGDSLSRASVTVTGLIPGQSYTLTGWWSCPDMVLGQTKLQIRVTDQGYNLSQTAWAHGPEMAVRLAGGGATRQDHVVVTDGQGGGIAVWSDQRGADLDLYAMRFLANGTLAPGWPMGGVPLCTASGDQRAPRAVPDGAGGTIVCWEDLRNGATDLEVYAQRITSSGAIASGWPSAASGGLAVAALAGNQQEPRIVPTSDGGAVIAWSDRRSGTSYDIYALRLAAAGARFAGWAANGNALCTATADQDELVALSDGADGAFVAFEDNRPSPNSVEVYLQRVAGNGSIAAGWPAAATGGFDVSNTSSFDQIGGMVSDGAGGVFVSWTGSGSAPRVTRRTSTGALAAGSWTSTGLTTCPGPGTCDGTPERDNLISDGAGGVLDVYSNNSVFTERIYAQRLTSTGAIAAGWPNNRLGLVTSGGAKYAKEVVEDGHGGALAVYSEDPGTGVLRALRVKGNATVESGYGSGRPISLLGTLQFGLSPSDSGGAFVSWTDLSGEVKAMRIDRYAYLGYPGPSFEAIVDHAADQGGSVDLRWSAGDLVNEASFRSSGQYRFWRATEGSQPPVWELIGTQLANDLCTRVFVAPTPNIATGGMATKTRYRLEAHLPASSRSWFSFPDSAFSVDNLAPAAPVGFGGSAGGGNVSLSWTANAESDLMRYRLYRGNYAGFPTGPGTLTAEPTGTTYVGPASPYFKITALDTHGNESGTTVIGPLVAAGVGERTGFELALGAPQPTPARGSTLLRFTLPARSLATLAIYDVNGRRMRELVRGSLPEGEHAIRWDGRDGSGAEVASGLYFVRLETPWGLRNRRLVLLP